jgi:hypothetical protein
MRRSTCRLFSRAGGRVTCPPGGCIEGATLSPTSTFDAFFNYRAGVTAPTPVQLTVVVAPNSVPGACGLGSSGGYATKTFVTSNPTTTTPVVPPCIATPVLDSDDVVTLQVGQAATVPIVVTGNPGSLFDLFLDDLGAGGVFACPPSGCVMGIIIPPSGTIAVDATYTPSTPAPASVTLRVTISPHFVPFSCGVASQGGTDMKTYPVAP